MSNDDLKTKIAEWLKIKEEVSSLEKAQEDRSITDIATSIKRKADQLSPANVGVHEQHPAAPKGQSIAGHDYQVGKKIRSNGNKDHLGFMRHAIDNHKRKLMDLKLQPKANLPKTEKMEKGAIKPATIARPDKGFGAIVDRTPKPKVPVMAPMKKDSVNPALAPKDRKVKELQQKIDSGTYKPDASKIADAMIKKPEPIKKNAYLSSMMKDIRAKKMKKKEVIPALVSEPIVENRIDSNTPKQINAPEIMNSYKSENSESTGNLMALNNIVTHLKNKGK